MIIVKFGAKWCAPCKAIKGEVAKFLKARPDVRVVEKILGLFGFDLERHSRRLDTVVMASPASCCLPPLRDWHHRHSAPWSNAKFCAGFCGLCLGCSLATMQLVNSGEFNPVVYEKAKKLVRED